MTQLNDTIIKLGDDDMKSIAGGDGGCIDPMGGEGTNDGGDVGSFIDPNG